MLDIDRLAVPIAPLEQKLFTKLNEAVFVSLIAEFDEFTDKTEIVVVCSPNFTVEATESRLILSTAEPLNGEAGVEDKEVDTPVESVLVIVKLTGSAEVSVNVVLLFANVKSEGVDKVKAETATNDSTKATTAKSEINVLFMLMCCNSVITMVFKYFYCEVSK